MDPLDCPQSNESPQRCIDRSILIISPTQSVAKVGESGEVVTVSRGFARNFLIPQRKAKARFPAPSASPPLATRPA